MKWAKLVSAGALCILSGCSLFSPFADPQQPRPGLRRDARGVPIKNADGNVEPTFVSVDQAREYARALQDAYRRKVREQSTLRQINNSALIALASSAIGVAATGGASSAAAALGISGAGVGAIGSQLVVAIQRQIYTQGGAALECIIGAAARTPEPPGTARATQALATILARLGATRSTYTMALGLLPGCADADDYNDALEVLTGIWGLLQAEERYAEQMQRALQRVDGRGQILLSAVESVRWRVDDELVKSEPDMLAFDNALKQSLESAAASYRTAPSTSATPSTAPAVPPGVKNALQPFRVCSELFTAVTTAQNESQSLAMAVAAAEQAMADVQTAPPYDPSLFSNCALTNPIGVGTLRTDPAEASMATGAAATLQTLVRGGRAPYSVQDGVLPSGVTVQAGSALSDGQIYTATVTAAAAPKAGAPIIVLFKDSAGATTSFVVRAASAPAPGAAATSPAPATTTTAAATVASAKPVTPPLPPPTDARVKKVQEGLVEAGYSPGDANGEWRKETRDAIIKFLTANADANAAPIPKLDDLTESELLNLVEGPLGLKAQ